MKSWKSPPETGSHISNDTIICGLKRKEDPRKYTARYIDILVKFSGEDFHWSDVVI